MKNSLIRINIWLDKREVLKYILISFLVITSVFGIQYGNFICILMLLFVCAITIFRMFVIEGIVELDRSKYDVPSVGDIVVVKKNFYYDGRFRKFINTSDPSQKPNWWKISKGTEMVIIEVKECIGDWEIRFIDNSPSRGDMFLYYLETRDYWDTKANIRNKTLNKLGI